MWGPVITDEEASSVFEESPSLELLTPGENLVEQFELNFINGKTYLEKDYNDGNQKKMRQK